MEEDNLCSDKNKGIISKKFSKGEIVFKILTLKDGTTKDYGMVITKEDYEKKLYTHLYQPFLFIISIELRIAYLYDCLNRQFKNSRDEEYVFIYREIRTNEWKEWFKVKPYIDNIYQEVSNIEYLC